MPQSFASACVESNSLPPSCDCLAHRFGNAADGPDRTPSYGSDMSEAEWRVVRPLLPVPAWLEGRGGRPEGYCHRVTLDAVRYVVDNGVKSATPARGLPAVPARACLRPPLAGHGATRRTPRPAARPRPGEGGPLAGPDGCDRIPVGAGGGENIPARRPAGTAEEGGRPQAAPGGGLPRPGPGRRSERGERAGPRRRRAAASAAARAVLLHPTGVGGRRLCRPARRLGPREAPAHPSDRQTHR